MCACQRAHIGVQAIQFYAAHKNTIAPRGTNCEAANLRIKKQKRKFSKYWKFVVSESIDFSMTVFFSLFCEKKKKKMFVSKKLFKAKLSSGSVQILSRIVRYLTWLLHCLFPFFAFCSRHSFVRAIFVANFSRNATDDFLSTAFILLLLHLHNSICVFRIVLTAMQRFDVFIRVSV